MSSIERTKMPTQIDLTEIRRQLDERLRDREADEKRFAELKRANERALRRSEQLRRRLERA